MTDEEKIVELNKIAQKNLSFVDEFFNGLKPSEVGDDWMKQKIYSYGVPLVDKLYDLGYNSIEKIINIDIEKIKEINGFGPKKIDQLKHSIEKIKTTHNSGFEQVGF